MNWTGYKFNYSTNDGETDQCMYTSTYLTLFELLQYYYSVNKISQAKEMETAHFSFHD